MKSHVKRNLLLLLFVALFFVVDLQGTSAQVTRRLPEGVSLIWEANTYTPPFYKGKALYTVGADMRIIAFPEERFGDPDNLFYEWSMDGRVLGGDSGRGVRMFLLEGSNLVPSPLISVSVRQSADGEVIAAAGMRPTVTNPRIVMYENSPVGGTLFQHELLEHIEVHEEEVTLSTYPYFFSTHTRSGLEYVWSLNNHVVGSGPTLTLKKGESSGVGSVSLRIIHPNKLLQRGSRSLTISF